MRISNEEVTKLARRAAAHVAADVEAVEVNAQVFEKLMWELLLLRTRAEKPSVGPTPIAQVSHATKTCPGTIRAMGNR